MDFRFPSVFMVVLSTNLVILITYIFMHSKKLLFRFGFQILIIFLILTCLRMFLPFEFTGISHNIILPQSISRFVTGYMHRRFFNKTISWWHISVLVWVAGIFLYSGKYLKIKNSFEKYIEKYSKKPSPKSIYAIELKKIQTENQGLCQVELFLLPEISTPMVYGIKKPRILIPQNLHVEKEELSFILKHEVSHFIHHDLHMKLAIQCLSIIYWWNPILFLLKKQVDLLLEMRVDSTIAKSQEEKAVYTQCLLSVAKNSINDKIPNNVIPFCRKNTALRERCRMLLNEKTTKDTFLCKNLLLSGIVFLYALSFVFILESDYKNPEDLKGMIIPTLENSYMIDNQNGTYNFYINDKFICVTESTKYYMDGTAIYKNTKEAIVYEK